MTRPTDEELEAMAAKLDGKTHNMIEGHVQMEDAAAMLRACKTDGAMTEPDHDYSGLCTNLRSDHDEWDSPISLAAAEAIEALEAESEKWKQAFTVQSNKLQSVLHIEGVRAFLARHQKETDT